jgi:hypothetical protein
MSLFLTSVPLLPLPFLHLFLFPTLPSLHLFLFPPLSMLTTWVYPSLHCLFNSYVPLPYFCSSFLPPSFLTSVPLSSSPSLVSVYPSLSCLFNSYVPIPYSVPRSSPSFLTSVPLFSVSLNLAQLSSYCHCISRVSFIQSFF